MANWRRHLGVALLAATALASGCKGQAPTPAKAAAPATVAHPVTESKLNTVVLTADAEQKLGLKLADVEQRTLHRQRSYGGEVTLPPGALLTVAAPVTGTLEVPKGQTVPQVGAAVTAGRAMFTLIPHVITQAEHVALAQAILQLQQARIDADGQVKQAEVQVEAANKNFVRAERLSLDGAGTKKDRDDTFAQLELAQKGLAAALLRRQAVDSMQLKTDKGSVNPLEIKSPLKGVVRMVNVVTGEMVPAGAPLFEVMNVDTVWVKVPVYVGELADVAERKPARVCSLADAPGAKGVEAKPVPTPPTAQPQASAVDLYYELSNPKGEYRPGQRVSALLTLQDAEKTLGLPWSAVVHDIYGGTWVYVQKAERTFARQRVQVKYVVGDWAVLAEGPPPGTKVVTAGAAELFGTEFGYSK